MYYPDRQEFKKLAKQGNVIPVYKEMFADFDTPLSAFQKIGIGDFSYLLESVEGGEHMARYSFLGNNPSIVIESKAGTVSIRRSGKIETYITQGDPISGLKEFMAKFKFVDVKGLPRFCGGLVGYMGYDIARFIENIPDKNPEGFDIPDMQFMLTDTMLIFDHVDHKIKVVSNAVIDGRVDSAYEEACGKIDGIVKKLQKAIIKPCRTVPAKPKIKIDSNFPEKEFCEIVKKAKEYIKNGDIIQVVLSQRLKKNTEADAFSIYRALRSINPSPYMYYLKFGSCHIVGSSPEILVRCENRFVEVRPIAGTRRRGMSEKEDILLEKELLEDPKEKAEHVMLVDLGRNDIGRVCDYSTIKLEQFMRIERYSHVMHIVSDVTGRLSRDKDIYDLIKAVFPAGTVTGAPKVRAMEIIDELENIKRGPYAGSVGYISFSGNIDLCITIRTIIMKDKTAYIQAGAGIVLDSVPKKEYEETMNKAKALIKAVELSEEGFE